MTAAMERNQRIYDDAKEKGNATRMPDFIAKDIYSVLHDRIGRTTAKKKPRSPFEEYCRRHMDHPDIPARMKALRENGTQQLVELYSRFTRED